MHKSSILDYYLDNAERFGARTAAQVKRNGRYESVTWREMANESRKVSAALIALGVEPGARVCIIAQTRVEWVVLDMGILGAGAVTVPIYPSSLADECRYIAENAEATVVFAEDAAQVAKFLSERPHLKFVAKVIQLEGALSQSDGWVISYADFIKLGKPDVETLEARRKGLNKDSMLTIIYTSGTTGRPKGVVLTHDNMLYEAEVIAQVDAVREDDVQLFFLPLAHSFAKVLEIAWLATRHVMAFAESLQTLKENLGETRPTLMCGVPRVFEKFYAAVVQKGTAAGGLKARMFTAAVELSQQNGEAERRGATLSGVDAIKFGLLKKLVFAKVGKGLTELLGGRMRVMISGGAPLSPRIAWFFRDAGITILEGFGLTETSAGTCVNRPGSNRIGTVGPAMPGTEVRTAEDGEVLIRGRGVMREYWKNPEATREVVDRNGWYHTGDIGVIDPDGYLRITDRKKDLIVTAGGKNVAPQNIENMLKSHKLISQAVVHGDKRNFLSVLVTLDPEALKDLAAKLNLGNGAYAELTQKPEVGKAVQEIIDQINQELASFERLKKFKVLEHDFTQETGELTPTLKVKRKLIGERYKAVFDAFYTETY